MIHRRGPGAQAPRQEAYFDVVDCKGVVHSRGQTNMRKSLPLYCLEVVAVLAIVLKVHHRSRNIYLKRSRVLCLPTSCVLHDVLTTEARVYILASTGLLGMLGMKVRQKPAAHSMTVRKKPAAHSTPAHTQPSTSVEQPVLYEPHSDMEPEVAARPVQDWSTPPQMPSQACRPCWASHVVRALQEHGHLPSTKQARALSLTLWSDCSGINSEMFALSEIGKALHEASGTSVSWNLYFACDSDRRCLKFADLNFQPQHTSAAMENRHFETGKIWCEKHQENHDLPQQGVDLYVGTYPCAPWSRRGKRTGFSHPDAHTLIIGLDTIVFLAPAVWVIEIGEMPGTAGMSEIMEKVSGVINRGRTGYTIQTIKNLTPAWSGYPVRRTRLFICGWRQDIGGSDAVTQPLACLIENPLAVDCSYLGLLGLQSAMHWSRVGEYPTKDELVVVVASGCTCGLDPMVHCSVHLCKCHKCGANGLGCAWRCLLAHFVAVSGLADIVTQKSSTLTYLHVLEMHGRRGPDNPRMRIYMNLLALKVEVQPLSDTLTVADLSQNPPYGTVHCEGDVPTLTTSSHLWCFQAGEALSVHHLATLMGLDLSAITFDQSMTEAWFRQRLGLGVHIGNFGLVLLAALSPALSKCMS